MVFFQEVVATVSFHEMSTDCRIFVLSNVLMKVSGCVPDIICIAQIIWETITDAFALLMRFVPILWMMKTYWSLTWHNLHLYYKDRYIFIIHRMGTKTSFFGNLKMLLRNVLSQCFIVKCNSKLLLLLLNLPLEVMSKFFHH